MIKILAVSDEKMDLVNHRKEKIDLFINCGDLSPKYIEYLIDEFNPTVGVMVHGNHDEKYYSECLEEIKIEKSTLSNIYPGMIILNNNIVNIKKYIGKDFCIAGFSGALSHGTLPFHFKEKDVINFRKKIGKYRFLHRKEIDLVITHTPPHIKGAYEHESSYHTPSKVYGDIYLKYFPKLWLYGHVHRRYTQKPLDFKISQNLNTSFMLNSVPYIFIDYDDEMKKIINLRSNHAVKLQTLDL